MSDVPSSIEPRVQAYLLHHIVTNRLGAGVDGGVFRISNGNAIKVFNRLSAFRNELEAYERLQSHQVWRIKGVNVPQLIDSNEKLGILEMSVVKAPFLLDFAGAYLDFPPDFAQEAWDIWYARKEEEFEDDWPRAEAIYQHLIDQYGIYYLDLAPRNLRFR